MNRSNQRTLKAYMIWDSTSYSDTRVSSPCLSSMYNRVVKYQSRRAETRIPKKIGGKKKDSSFAAKIWYKWVRSIGGLFCAGIVSIDAQFQGHRHESSTFKEKPSPEVSVLPNSREARGWLVHHREHYIEARDKYKHSSSSVLGLKLGFQIRRERRTRRLKKGASPSTNWVNFNLHLQVLKIFSLFLNFSIFSNPLLSLSIDSLQNSHSRNFSRFLP